MKPLEPSDPRQVGRYQLLGKLGAGGMGSVYLARSSRGRTVAVKLVQSELARQPEFRQRFEQEVNAARRIGKRWTAPVLDCDTSAEMPWVATGYVAGPSLHEVVAGSHGTLPERTLLSLANGLSQSLRDIHAAGLIHRDLKPSNTLLTIDGPRVIDFGIARAMEQAGGGLTRTGAAVGSPGFMSPEQCRGETVTPASDVFCLGSVLTFAATGRTPFGDDRMPMHALMLRIVQHEQDLSGVPDGIRELVASCLAPAPEDRPTLDELLELTAAGDAWEDEDAEPWLPGALVAKLGKRAVELLDSEDPVHAPPKPSVSPPPARPTTPPTIVPPPPASPPPSPPASPEPSPKPAAAPLVAPPPHQPAAPAQLATSATPSPDQPAGAGAAAGSTGAGGSTSTAAASTSAGAGVGAGVGRTAGTTATGPDSPVGSGTPVGGDTQHPVPWSPPPPGDRSSVDTTQTMTTAPPPSGTFGPPIGSGPHTSGAGHPTAATPPPAHRKRWKTLGWVLGAAGLLTIGGIAGYVVFTGEDDPAGSGTADGGNIADSSPDSSSDSSSEATPSPTPTPTESGGVDGSGTWDDEDGAVDSAYLGVWEGEVLEDGEPTEIFRRLEIVQGDEEDVVAQTWNLHAELLCHGESELVSFTRLMVIDSSITDAEGSNSCRPYGEQSLNLQDDGTMLWSYPDHGLTAVLEQRDEEPGEDIVPEELIGSWSVTEDGTEHLVEIEQSAAGGAAVYWETFANDGYCEQEHALVTSHDVRPEIVTGPSRVETSEPSSVCDDGDVPTLTIEAVEDGITVTPAVDPDDSDAASGPSLELEPHTE